MRDPRLTDITRSNPEQIHRYEYRRVIVFLFVAAVAHLIALPFIGKRYFVITSIDKIKKAPVKVVSLNAKAKKALRKTRRAMAASSKAQTKTNVPKIDEKTPKPKDIAGQIVDIPPTADDHVPENARFLSEHNTHVERETRSRYQSQHYKNAMNEPTTTKRGQAQGPETIKDAKAIEINLNAQNTNKTNTTNDTPAPAVEIPKITPRDRLALKLNSEFGKIHNRDSISASEGNSDRLKLSLDQGSNQKNSNNSEVALQKGKKSIELVPQIGVLASLSGAPANDHLEGVDLGEGTFLNSRAFKYASFFNRIKRDVSNNWRPMQEYQRRDPTGNIYGFRSRETVLNITLKADGTLKDTKILQSSGLDFLDREAIYAFKRAGPFPNPPKGLIQNNDEISFPFGFYIDFSGRSRSPF
ncbi:MAG: TonB family protein [Deltaproteobacteria bacterium]|nr:TonB family protein [Deltaproteobacteria bacterium]